MTRTHVVIPDEIIDKVDELVGQRRPGQFVSEALAEKLHRI